MRTSEVGPFGFAGAAVDVVVVDCALVTTSEVVALGLVDAVDVVVAGCARVRTGEVVALDLVDAVDLVVVGCGTLAEVLVIGLSVAAAAASWPCSGMTVSCGEIEPPV